MRQRRRLGAIVTLLVAHRRASIACKTNLVRFPSRVGGAKVGTRWRRPNTSA
jgi:hypothetical protein